MKSNIKIFENKEFGSIRTMTDKNGEPWFVGKDVAGILGYSNPTKAIRDRVFEEDKMLVQLAETQRGSKLDPPCASKTNIMVINESGLYSLILSSKLESAKRFKRWVTSEVLPQIRKTGGYIPTMDMHTGEPLTESEIVHNAEQIMQRTIAHENLPADDCLTVSDIAKSLGLSPTELNKRLVRMGVQFWNGSRYRLTLEYANRGLAQDRSFHYYALDGEKKQRPYLVWTPKGVEFVKQLLND